LKEQGEHGSGGGGGVVKYCHFKGFFLLLPPTLATRLPSSSPSSPSMFTSFSLHFQFPNKRTIVASWHWLRETIALVHEVLGADHDAREAGGGAESARPWRGVLCQGNPSSRARSAKLPTLVSLPPLHPQSAMQLLLLGWPRADHRTSNSSATAAAQ
jgi:hypothetical protein